MADRYTLYRSLLKLYPKQYRQKYSEQMLQTLDDMLSDQSSRTAKDMLWLRAYSDLLINIPRQNLAMIGASAMQETPIYIRSNAIIGTALIMPFFILVLSGLLQKQWFADSGIWMAFATGCLLVLPAIALVLSIVSYIKWITVKNDKTNRTVVQRILDIRHTYPTIIVGFIGLFIVLFVPFHDSAHCLVGNPVRVVHNPNQTYQCVKNGFLGGK